MNDKPINGLADMRTQLVALFERRKILQTAATMLTAHGGGVAWAAGASAPGELVLHEIAGERTHLLRDLVVPDGLGLTGRVHRSGNPEWVDDYLRSSAITHTFDRHIDAEGVLSLLAVPIIHESRAFGVLALGSREDKVLGDRAVSRAARLADDVALALAVADQARLAREVAVHEERGRLAAELHDSVGALLFAIGAGAATLTEAAVIGADRELASQLERLQRHAAEAASALRDSLRMLRATPAALELCVALRGDCAAFSDRTGVPTELVLLDDDPPTMPPSRTEVLVAAVREALLNIEKHAQASAVVVTVSRPTSAARNTLVVAVTDDGVGLDSGRRPPGIGLASSRQAIARLGGVLHVTSDPHGGTTWQVRLPC